MSLYLLLMEERYGASAPHGLLWNVQSPGMQLVPRRQDELAPLLARRNALAAHLWQARPSAPPMLRDASACRRCHSASVCATYHAVAEGGRAETSGLEPGHFESLTAHIAPAHAAFASHWMGLVDWEEAGARARRRGIWALSGPEREAEGGCVARLAFDHRPAACSTQEGDLHLYTFERQQPEGEEDEDGGEKGEEGKQRTEGQQQQQKTKQPALTELGMAPGDMVLLSLDGLHAAVGRVTVHDVGARHITVASRRPVRIERYERQWRALEAAEDDRAGGGDSGSRGGDTVAATAAAAGAAAAPPRKAPWRLDKDEIASMSVTLRTNLLRLVLDGGCARLSRLRELVIDLAAPRAHSLVAAPNSDPTQTSATQAAVVTSSTPGASAGLRTRLRLEAAERYIAERRGASASSALNEEQAEAVRRVAGAEDYALVLGMPGTGKTSTIAAAICALVSSGARVLVSAYTNSAVDNVLLKLAGMGVPLVRLGRVATAHPDVKRFMPGGAAYPDRGTAALAKAMDAARVVGVPCLSCSSPLLAGRSFDVAVVDEAGQVTLPAVLGPLMLARAFVLVGDHYQLSPLVVSARAAEGGLGASLFKRLCEAHPQAVVALRRQYRMAAPIMALPNELVYGGQLRAGSEAVAAARLELPDPGALARHPAWLRPLLDPEVRVAFLDTDAAAAAGAAAGGDGGGNNGSGGNSGGGAGETQLREGTINAGEAAAVASLVAALLDAGVPAREVGVASPYRAQVQLLQSMVAAAALPLSSSRAQGAEGGGGGDGGGGDAAEDADADAAAAVEVLTVDRYQGRDKAAVLLSLVRSNPQRAAGQLLADWQRLNVAVTRARAKLLIVGSASTVSSVPLLAELVSMARRGGWLHPLPAEAVATAMGEAAEAAAAAMEE